MINCQPAPLAANSVSKVRATNMHRRDASAPVHSRFSTDPTGATDIVVTIPSGKCRDIDATVLHIEIRKDHPLLEKLPRTDRMCCVRCKRRRDAVDATSPRFVVAQQVHAATDPEDSPQEIHAEVIGALTYRDFIGIIACWASETAASAAPCMMRSSPHDRARLS